MTNAELDALAVQFHDLFRGMEEAHGKYLNVKPDLTSTNGKLKGDAVTVRQPITDELWKLHLSGEQGIGIIPIRRDNSACFGAIDIDEYPIDTGKILAAIEKFQLPVVPCRSKSGGLHLFLFTSGSVPAAHMVSKLRQIAAKLGYGDSEIFPKQTVILADSNDLGAWINCPYYDVARTTRHALKPDGSAMAVTEFLDAALIAKQEATPEWIARPLPQTLEILPDGPPCLQHLVEQGISEGGRNTVLFNLGVYCRKANNDNWQDPLREMNREHMKPPLSHDEVEGRIKSVSRKDYFYTCNDAPLAQFCDKGICRTRKFGIGASNTMPVLGSLSKLMTDPPVFFLEVGGQRLELTAEQLFSSVEFQKRCGVALKGVLVPVLTRAKWEAYIRQAVETVVEIPAPVEMSPGGHLESLLEEFCTDRYQARDWTEVRLGMAYTTDGKTHFQLDAFIGFVHRKDKGEYKRRTITKWLHEYGAEDYVRRIGKDIRLWKVKAFPADDMGPLPVPEAVTQRDAPGF